MEQFLTSALGSLGVTGVGYGFMYMLLKHYLQSGDKTISAVDKLCDKIDKLVESNFKLQQDNSASASQAALVYTETKEQYAKTSAEMKEQYAKISYKIDALKDDVEDNKTLLTRVFDRININANVGQILVRQGIITQEQLDDALKEQQKYM